MGRKVRIPAETLLGLRRRLVTLPARAPERRLEVDRVAESGLTHEIFRR